MARLATVDSENKPHLVPVVFLFFFKIQGRASLIGKKVQHNELELEKAHKLLYRKYRQYKKIGIGELCIKIDPEKVIAWKNH